MRGQISKRASAGFLEHLGQFPRHRRVTVPQHRGKVCKRIGKARPTLIEDQRSRHGFQRFGG